ncbi:hypothetical protein BCON_0270g00100 [Botryotinia convoluta]|uniref:Intradiol ring-cleavage dioxygenases domain-containing protein n=1 Tax=Botryotinia convoluta TaxID=54673 RepID=A0A4Z1HRM5_9HELO|nr:hypothetical protein BCON_0270g00100 [Botryotinia convoluta]
MIYSSLLSKLVTAACVFHISTAHPGQTFQELQGEIVERDIFFEDTKTPRDLSHCADILRKRGAEDRNRERIAAAITKARADLGLPQKKAPIKARATNPVSISHLSGLNVTPTTPNVEEIIYSNSSCILSLEGETGPFYVSGEHIRSDLRETQAGVPVVIDGQFLDTSTCEPIQDLYWDIWNCNSTGVYGGIPASPINGNAGDASNINKTFLRGLQPTDANGIAQFTSLFPGHYAGRTTHMHVVAHIGGTVLSNGTYTGGKASHIGQIAGGSDPFFNYVLLGDTVSDGIFAWITFGVNQGATYTASAAARLTANGGVPIAGGGRPPIA